MQIIMVSSHIRVNQSFECNINGHALYGVCIKTYEEENLSNKENA